MTTEARMNEPSPRQWTIAVDRFPRKPNGDRLVNSTQRAVNEWYAAHPDAWDLVEAVPVPDEQAIERGDAERRQALSEGDSHAEAFRRGLAASLEHPESPDSKP